MWRSFVKGSHLRGGLICGVVAGLESELFYESTLGSVVVYLLFSGLFSGLLSGLLGGGMGLPVCGTMSCASFSGAVELSPGITPAFWITQPSRSYYEKLGEAISSCTDSCSTISPILRLALTPKC